MSEQFPLFGRGGRPSLDLRFARFVRENPDIVNEFERRALRLIAVGRDHFSADAILHAIRFDTALATKGDVFAINNDFSSRLARWFAERHPEHAAFFSTRRLAS